MRLLKQVRRIEQKRLAAAAGAGVSLVGPVALCWSVDEARVGRPLVAGEFLAVDVHRVRVDGLAWEIRTVERVTSDSADLGFVYDASGSRVGRVVRLDGSLLTIDIDVLTLDASDLSAPGGAGVQHGRIVRY